MQSMSLALPQQRPRPRPSADRRAGPTPTPAARLNADELASHRAYLHGFAMGQVKDQDLADDLVQETLIAAMTSAERFSGHSSVRTWLVSILRHKILDTFRQQARDPISLDALRHGDDEDGGGQTEEVVAAEVSPMTDSFARGPEAVIAEKALWARFEQQLEQLPSRTARAFVLSEILGHETSEISEMLATTPENVWGMVHRARKSLQSAMANERNPVQR